MRYLVTGATGLLGNNIVRELLSRGQSVRVLTRTTSDPRPLAGLEVEQVAGDVRDSESVRRALAGRDVVIHAAGHVHIGWSQPEQHAAINVAGAKTVAAAAREAGAKMVHVSSVNALGLGKLSSPAGEDNPLPGIVACPYPETKRQGDCAVLEEVSRGLSAVIVHPGFMLGPWDWKPSSGKMLLEVTKFAPLAPVGAHSMCDVRDVATGAIAAAGVVAGLPTVLQPGTTGLPGAGSGDPRPTSETRAQPVAATTSSPVTTSPTWTPGSCSPKSPALAARFFGPDRSTAGSAAGGAIENSGAPVSSRS